MPEEAKWYIVHTYSGYENKVASNLEKTIENRGLGELIQEVIVPTETVTEMKDNKKCTVERKIFPGYVIIKMVLTDETWYVVRNTRGVTSFVGPGSKPVPLTDAEVYAMGIGGEVENLNVELGDSVRVASGPFANSVGVIQEINTNKRTVVVSLSIFGRETPVELDFAQIDKI